MFIDVIQNNGKPYLRPFSRYVACVKLPRVGFNCDLTITLAVVPEIKCT